MIGNHLPDWHQQLKVGRYTYLRIQQDSRLHPENWLKKAITSKEYEKVRSTRITSWKKFVLFIWRSLQDSENPQNSCYPEQSVMVANLREGICAGVLPALREWILVHLVQLSDFIDPDISWASWPRRQPQRQQFRQTCPEFADFLNQWCWNAGLF